MKPTHKINVRETEPEEAKKEPHDAKTWRPAAVWSVQPYRSRRSPSLDASLPSDGRQRPQIVSALFESAVVRSLKCLQTRAHTTTRFFSSCSRQHADARRRCTQTETQTQQTQTQDTRQRCRRRLTQAHAPSAVSIPATDIPLLELITWKKTRSRPRGVSSVFAIAQGLRFQFGQTVFPDATWRVPLSGAVA